MAAKFSDSKSVLCHIFRKAKGHVEDTSENRKLLLEVANDEGAQLESDQYGNRWAAKVLSDGRQAWTQVRNSIVIDAGINDVPKNFNRRTGMKKP